MSGVLIVADPVDDSFAGEVRATTRGLDIEIARALPAEESRTVLLVWSAARPISAADVPRLIELWSLGRLLIARRDDTPLPLGLGDLETMTPEAPARETALKLRHATLATADSRKFAQFEKGLAKWRRLVERGKAREAADIQKTLETESASDPQLKELYAGAFPAAAGGGSHRGLLWGGMAGAIVVGIIGIWFVVAGRPAPSFKPAAEMPRSTPLPAPLPAPAPMPNAEAPPVMPPSPRPNAEARITELERQLAELKQNRPSTPVPVLPTPAQAAVAAVAPNAAFPWIESGVGIAVLLTALSLWLLLRSRHHPGTPRAMAEATVGSPAGAAPNDAAIATMQVSSNGDALFISYAHRDLLRVDPLVMEIEAMGRAVWIDRAGMTGGPGWAGQITRAIKGSRAVVLMASPSAYASDQVVRELYLAMGAKKLIVPIELEPTDVPDELAYILAPFQRHALHAGDMHSVLSRALAAI